MEVKEREEGRKKKEKEVEIKNVKFFEILRGIAYFYYLKNLSLRPRCCPRWKENGGTHVKANEKRKFKIFFYSTTFVLSPFFLYGGIFLVCAWVPGFWCLLCSKHIWELYYRLEGLQRGCDLTKKNKIVLVIICHR